MAAKRRKAPKRAAKKAAAKAQPPAAARCPVTQGMLDLVSAGKLTPEIQEQFLAGKLSYEDALDIVRDIQGV